MTTSSARKIVKIFLNYTFSSTTEFFFSLLHKPEGRGMLILASWETIDPHYHRQQTASACFLFLVTFNFISGPFTAQKRIFSNLNVRGASTLRIIVYFDILGRVSRMPRTIKGLRKTSRRILSYKSPSGKTRCE